MPSYNELMRCYEALALQPICRSGVWPLHTSANVVSGRRWSTS